MNGGDGSAANSGRSLLPNRPRTSDTAVTTVSNTAMLPRPLQSAPARMGGRATPTSKPKMEKISRPADRPARSLSLLLISGNSDVQFMTKIVQQKSNSRTTARK